MTFKLAAILDLKVKTRSNCKTDIKYEFLDPQTPETIYYTAVSAKLLKSYFSRWPTAAILDFCQLRLMPTLLRATPLQFHSLTFKEDKNTKKRIFALHGHGSAPDDPTNFQTILACQNALKLTYSNLEFQKFSGEDPRTIRFLGRR